MLLTDLKPPLPNGSDCKCRRVVGHTQDDKPSVPALVIDPIGNSYPDRITPKVMVQHGPFPASPTAARVLEIAHQFLRFRVHADHRPAVLQIAMSLTDQVSKLAVPILVVCPSQPFAIRSQAILTLMQQTPNAGPTNGEPLATQSSAKPANRFMRPLHPRGRITCRNILQQILQTGLLRHHRKSMNIKELRIRTWVNASDCPARSYAQSVAPGAVSSLLQATYVDQEKQRKSCPYKDLCLYC